MYKTIYNYIYTKLYIYIYIYIKLRYKNVKPIIKWIKTNLKK